MSSDQHDPTKGIPESWPKPGSQWRMDGEIWEVLRVYVDSEVVRVVISIDDPFDFDVHLEDWLAWVAEGSFREVQP